MIIIILANNNRHNIIIIITLAYYYHNNKHNIMYNIGHNIGHNNRRNIGHNIRHNRPHNPLATYGRRPRAPRFAGEERDGRTMTTTAQEQYEFIRFLQNGGDSYGFWRNIVVNDVPVQTNMMMTLMTMTMFSDFRRFFAMFLCLPCFFI